MQRCEISNSKISIIFKWNETVILRIRFINGSMFTNLEGFILIRRTTLSDLSLVFVYSLSYICYVSMVLWYIYI